MKRKTMDGCSNSICPNKKDCYRAQVDCDVYIQFEFDPETEGCGDFIKYW